jgi:hypothetical protein
MQTGAPHILQPGSIGATMADETKTDKVTLEERVVSSLAMIDALAKLLIAKGIITRCGTQSPIERGAGELSSRAEPAALTVMCGRFGASFQTAMESRSVRKPSLVTFMIPAFQNWLRRWALASLFLAKLSRPVLGA